MYDQNSKRFLYILTDSHWNILKNMYEAILSEQHSIRRKFTKPIRDMKIPALTILPLWVVGASSKVKR